MTVTYTHKVASSKGFGCFGKLLFRWKGSIYKLVWPDLLLYALLYGLCSVTYRLLLTEPQKRVFESVAIYCGQFTDLIPVAFVLGFFVSIVVQRWWEQYMSLPWPDSLALFVSTCIVGQNDRSRLMRRTIMRYVNLSFVITLAMISPRVKKRFPTLDHMLDAGLITATEKKIFDDLDSKTSHPKYWMPLVWAGTIVSSARKERRIRDDFAVKTLLDEISKFRGLCGGLLSYDWISIPLVYTQVVTLAVYTFFLGTIMGRQFLDPAQNIPNQRVDLYVPWFTFLQFFFYMGWLKVAETLVNPFGEDDDDFEINWLIDRNIQVSYLIVDEMHEEHPDMIPDIHWDDVFPVELPYTIAAEQFKRMAPQGSTFNIEVPEEDQEIAMPVLKEVPSDEEEERNMTKIDMKMSSDSLQSLGSGIAMKPIYRNSGLGGHKGSFLSAIVNKLRPSGSSSSMRRQTRTASRLSNSSEVTTKSKDSLSAYEYSKRNRRNRFALRKGAVDSKLIIPKEDWLTEGKYSKEINMDNDGSIVIRIKRASTEVLPSSSVKQAPPSPGEVVGSFSSGVTMVAPSPPKENPKGDIAPKKKSTGNLINSVSQQASDVFELNRLLSQELGSDDDPPENVWMNTDSSSDSDCEKREQTCFVEDNNFPSLKRNWKPSAKYSKSFDYPSVQNSTSTGTVIENPLKSLTESETASFLPKEGVKEEKEEKDWEKHEGGDRKEEMKHNRQI